MSGFWLTLPKGDLGTNQDKPVYIDVRAVKNPSTRGISRSCCARVEADVPHNLGQDRGLKKRDAPNRDRRRPSGWLGQRQADWNGEIRSHIVQGAREWCRASKKSFYSVYEKTASSLVGIVGPLPIKVWIKHGLAE